MKASIDSVWIALEVDQKAALAAPLMPGAAFLALDRLALLAALISLGYKFEVLGLVWYVSNLLLRFLHAFALHPSSLGSQFLHNQNLFRPSPHRWGLPAQGGLLKASQAYLEARLVNFVIHSFVQERKIWFQWVEVLDVSDSKLRRFLIKIRIVQPCWSHKRIGINRWFLWPAKSTGRYVAGAWDL